MKKYVVVLAVVFSAVFATATAAEGTGKHYAFYDMHGVVKQTISGNLTNEQLDVFMRDYSILFRAVGFTEFDPASGIGIGTDLDGPSAAESPSVEPTAAPTEDPTIDPSEEPSEAPSISPCGA